MADDHDIPDQDPWAGAEDPRTIAAIGAELERISGTHGLPKIDPFGGHMMLPLGKITRSFRCCGKCRAISGWKDLPRDCEIDSAIFQRSSPCILSIHSATAPNTPLQQTNAPTIIGRSKYLAVRSQLNARSLGAFPRSKARIPFQSVFGGSCQESRGVHESAAHLHARRSEAFLALEPVMMGAGDNDWIAVRTLSYLAVVRVVAQARCAARDVI